MPLSETARYFGRLLGEQQPVGGMSGQVNRTLVRQFRMPGYPFVLVTTDLLQEGEDLHTFCSAIHHYGISWTSSAMEQRIGRIDRVRSQTERRLGALERESSGADLLQVHYPHLEETVEVLQVRRVLQRMNTFLRLMHKDLAPALGEKQRLDVSREILNSCAAVEVIAEHLDSAFPVRQEFVAGRSREPAVAPDLVARMGERLRRLRDLPLGALRVDWEPESPRGSLTGTARLESGRVQPFVLVLHSEGDHFLLRCVSPVGRVHPGEVMDEIVESTSRNRVCIGAILTEEARTYDLTVEDDVLLGNEENDVARVAMLVRRVVDAADVLEYHHLEGVDQRLDDFREDIEKECRDAE